MDAASTLAKGLVIGISIAAPVGPIGLLCIRRTLAGGMGLGLASGLGAASADAFYGAVAAFGLAAVSDLLVSHEAALRLVGGLFLLWLGARTAFARPPSGTEGGGTGQGTGRGAARGRAGDALGAFLSTAALTAANPSTILSFVAVFGALGLGAAAEGQGTGAAAAMVAGVFLGSALWWLVLSLGVSAARGRVGPRAMAWINRASGAVLAAFGVAALSGLIA
jgi:threonine/homoserine/homoserine lactone efflux protein